MFRLLVFCVFGTVVAAQTPAPRDDPEDLLLAVRKKLLLTVNRLPKYLCTETVDRSTFQPDARVIAHSCDDLASLRKQPNWTARQYTSDRLRVDVAVWGDSEMYSWAGQNHFGDHSLADLVGSGLTSTGAFATFLASIFGSNAASFTYNGDVPADGRQLVEFGFRVPLQKSGYRVGRESLRDIVSYDGTFLVDPKTHELVRLVIHAGQIPDELKICESTTSFDYGSIRLNGSEFVLPKEVDVRVLNTDGSEFANRTAFAGCHEFRGESSLILESAPEDPQAVVQKTKPEPAVLPAGLPFQMALTHPIDTATAAAGDEISAKLISPIKAKHSGILVPKGAAVTGRIVQLETVYGTKSQSLTVGIKLETIEVGGLSQPFNARVGSVVERRSKVSGPLIVRQDLGSFDQILDSDDGAIGFLRFPRSKPDYVIGPGLEIDAITNTLAGSPPPLARGLQSPIASSEDQTADALAFAEAEWKLFDAGSFAKMYDSTFNDSMKSLKSRDQWIQLLADIARTRAVPIRRDLIDKTRSMGIYSFTFRTRSSNPKPEENIEDVEVTNTNGAWIVVGLHFRP